MNRGSLKTEYENEFTVRAFLSPFNTESFKISLSGPTVPT